MGMNEKIKNWQGFACHWRTFESNIASPIFSFFYSFLMYLFLRIMYALQSIENGALFRWGNGCMWYLNTLIAEELYKLFFDSKQHRNWLEFNFGNYSIFHRSNINKLSWGHNDRSEKFHIKQYYHSIIIR